MEEPAVESDSDDEAPEAVSTTTAKSSALEEAKAQRESRKRAAEKEKERRRQRDQQLKLQKEASKRNKKKEVVQEESEEEQDNEDEDEDEDDNRLLPAELLAQAAAEDNLAKQHKRSHLTAADFERMEAEAEAENKAKKRRIQANERRVGEYTVKVLNNRPRPAPTDTKILNFRDRLMHRKSIPRKDAMLHSSQNKKRIGKAAYQFHRK
ncbi:hypothetical protein K492DRAFT_213488 [Lichtheimia hyalospora FSU 10163]|nr:hypothetical protein K492DRAFT_213488 [Lichtheimia hyalospora FSU 10163]